MNELEPQHPHEMIQEALLLLQQDAPDLKNAIQLLQSARQLMRTQSETDENSRVESWGWSNDTID
ncbi:hypothetical protein [Effusibacillus dendaii]|uniref:Uncharacterized protein n=1 Tax=Effusibacillus dendaii TaxID=2743772 RepID=A0A7I8DF53_9BACL|nr:hypothetical protein [Effusibacillus dendaii]BCJ86541.1 hypothetical protein skT53_15260 [Effusibacillus dendaii]